MQGSRVTIECQGVVDPRLDPTSLDVAWTRGARAIQGNTGGEFNVFVDNQNLGMFFVIKFQVSYQFSW